MSEIYVIPNGEPLDTEVREIPEKKQNHCKNFDSL